MTKTKAARQGFDKDCYETHPHLFDFLNKKFNFIIDACTDSYKDSESETFNSKCDGYFYDALEEWFPQVIEEFTEQGLVTSDDARTPNNLDDLFNTYSIFMNPPYSNPGPFLERAWEFSRYMRVVCLVPATILTCKYLDFLDLRHGKCFVRDWDKGLKIHHLSRRVNFYYQGVEQKGVPFGCCLMIMDRRGCN